MCHGGFGSTLRSLRHGLPLVVVPLFSTDQWANAGAVQRVGAGLALDRDRATRSVLGLPDSETMSGLTAAVERVLTEPSNTRAAARMAEADRRSTPIATAADELATIAASAPPALRD